MTIFEKLVNAGIPVISANENGEISTEILTADQEKTFKDILLEHFNPSKYAEILLERSDKAQLKAEYLNTIATLQQIEDAVNPTNGQVISAVKFLAKTLRLLLKLIARSI